MKNVGVNIALLIVSVLATDQCKIDEAKYCINSQEPALRNELKRAKNNTNNPDYTKYCGMLKSVKDCMEEPLMNCNKTYKASRTKKLDRESGTDTIDCPGFDWNFNGAGTAARSLTFIVITTAIAAFILQ